MRLAPVAFALLALAAAPALAQRWGYPGAYPYGGDRFGWDRPARSIASSDRSREGKVEVTRFLADGTAAQALGRGAISVSAAEDGTADERERATYEAAVIDRLAGGLASWATQANEGSAWVGQQTRHSGIRLACAQRHVHGAELAFRHARESADGVSQVYAGTLAPGQTVGLDKYVAYAFTAPFATDTVDALLARAISSAST